MMNNKPEDKLNYIDFLKNDEFLKWQFYKTEELDQYWSDYLIQNPECKEALDEAINRFSKIELRKEKLSEEKIESLYNKIIYNSRLRIRRKRRIKYYSAVAACIGIFIISTVFIQFLKNQHENPTKSNHLVTGEIMPSEDIKLISGDNTVDIAQNAEFTLNSAGEISIMEENQIISSSYHMAKNNRLVIPFGKRSTLILPDGTKMWLNSGTELEFPTKFDAKERRIRVNGEIFIEVAEDKSKPFYVETAHLTVRVYGTRFNVSSYTLAENEIVLVDGKVEVQSAKQTVFLNPGELYSLNQSKTIHKKVDVDEYISWKDGYFIFNDVPISTVLKKIGRYYNVNFDNTQLELSSKKCTGKLFLSEDFGQVMDIICAISNTTYTRTGNKIFINNN